MNSISKNSHIFFCWENVTDIIVMKQIIPSNSSKIMEYVQIFFREKKNIYSKTFTFLLNAIFLSVSHPTENKVYFEWILESAEKISGHLFQNSLANQFHSSQAVSSTFTCSKWKNKKPAADQIFSWVASTAGIFLLRVIVAELKSICGSCAAASSLPAPSIRV